MAPPEEPMKLLERIGMSSVLGRQRYKGDVRVGNEKSGCELPEQTSPIHLEVTAYLLPMTDPSIRAVA